MFENKMIAVPALGQDVKVYASRIIASWYKIGGKITDVRWTLSPFAEWCRDMGISDDDIWHCIHLATNGKLELQTLGRQFLREYNKGETSE